jgi:hypothetical protein
MQNGKGSKPRPIKNFDQFSNNWEQINWNNKKPKKNEKSKNQNTMLDLSGPTRG